MKLRIKFAKFGPVRFIGHLDLMRFFQKMIRRAEIDIAYSQGFSPHQIMSFAAPLGVGIESNGEYLDIEVNSVTTSKDMLARMNNVSVEGVQLLSIRKLPDDCKNAMASVAAASYTVRFRNDRKPAIDFVKVLPSFLAMDEIPYEKETKKGSTILNLKEAIYELHVNEDNSIFMLVNASSAGNIKPAMVIEALLSANGETLKENALLITREDTLEIDSSTGDFISMGDIGDEIL